MRIWRIDVGRVPLYLLDTNIPQNNPDDRQITGRLYSGDHDMRICEEMVLGIGGIRALRALGKKLAVCHMNEGHSAFSGLERMRLYMEEHDRDFAAAREAVVAGTCFTSYTTVPAATEGLRSQWSVSVGQLAPASALKAARGNAVRSGVAARWT